MVNASRSIIEGWLREMAIYLVVSRRFAKESGFALRPLVTAQIDIKRPITVKMYPTVTNFYA